MSVQFYVYTSKKYVMMLYKQNIYVYAFIHICLLGM